MMIELSGVSKRFHDGGRDVLILDSADLTIEKGQVVLLSGVTGAGKTTALQMLYGAHRADLGRIKVFGHDIGKLRRSSIALLRRRVGIVPQDLRLLEDRSALENVGLALEVKGSPIRVARIRAAEMLSELGLADNVEVPVSQLSLGEQQRVAIARALVGEPGLILFDEPSAHQDPRSCELLLRRLAGATGMVVTNDPQMLAAVATYGWRHFELRGGNLEPIDLFDFEVPDTDKISFSADCAAEIPGDLQAVEESGEIEIIEGEAVAEPNIESIQNVVPFPLKARAGGSE